MTKMMDFSTGDTSDFWFGLQLSLCHISEEIENLACEIGRTEDGWLRLNASENQDKAQAWRHLQNAKMELILCCRQCDAVTL